MSDIKRALNTIARWERQLDKIVPETVGDAVDLDMHREDLEHLRDVVRSAQAPASGEVEPVAWECTEKHGATVDVAATRDVMETYRRMGRTVRPLVYADTHPPAKVPEMKQPMEAYDPAEQAYRMGWNDCRAQILTTPQPASGEPEPVIYKGVCEHICVCGHRWWSGNPDEPCPRCNPQPAQQGSVPDEMTYEDVRDLLALAWKGAVTTDDETQVQAIEDKIIAKRTHPFIGDYRKQPKTDFFCAMCQRDLKPGKSFDYVFLGDPAEFVVHPSYLDGSEIKVAIGPECSKKIPAAYRVNATPQQGSVPEEWWRHTLEEALAMMTSQPMTLERQADAVTGIRHLLAATPQPEGDGWIKCSERLPTDGDADCKGNVWAFSVKRGEVMTTFPSTVLALCLNDKITHWMPTGLKRPHPPVEQEGE